MLDETIVTETPPLYCCEGHIGEQVRVPITGHRAQRIVHGAINGGPGEVAAMVTKSWTPEEHPDFLSVIRSHWRGWDLVLVEDRASPPTTPERLDWAETRGIEVRLLPQATPELNAMDPLWKHAKREAVGSRATATVEASTLAVCQHVLRLSPRDRLRQAGILSGSFWLTK